MGRRAKGKQGSHVQKKSSGSSESTTTDPAVAKLLMSACVAQWGEHHGSKWGAQFLRAEDWTFESLQTLSVENSTQRVGLNNMRRLQVTEIAHEVARQYVSGKAAVAPATVVSKYAHPHIGFEEMPSRSREMTAPILVVQSHGEGIKARGAGGESTQGSSVAGVARTGSEHHAGGDVVPVGVKTAPHNCVEADVSQQVANAAPHGESSACVAICVVSQFMELLRAQGRNPISLQRVVEGHEQQWQKSVAAALKDLQCEFHIGDLLQKYHVLCPMSKELFLRELRGKATRILAYKKRHRKAKPSERSKVKQSSGE